MDLKLKKLNNNNKGIASIIIFFGLILLVMVVAVISGFIFITLLSEFIKRILPIVAGFTLLAVISYGIYIYVVKKDKIEGRNSMLVFSTLIVSAMILVMWSTNIEVFSAGSFEFALKEYRNPLVKVTGNDVSVTVYLENYGNQDMVDYWIVELQPRPHGLLPLSGVSQQLTCDVDHPENVHRRFYLTGKEKMSFTLKSRNLPDGKYDLYLISVTKCWHWGDWEGNDGFPPYYRGRKIATVNVPEGTSPTTTTTTIPPNCGDGICDPTRENKQNCPKDCGSELNIPWTEILIGLGLLIVGIGIFYYLKDQGNKKNKGKRIRK